MYTVQKEDKWHVLRVQNISVCVIVLVLSPIYKINLTDQFISDYPFVDVFAKMCPEYYSDQIKYVDVQLHVMIFGHMDLSHYKKKQPKTYSSLNTNSHPKRSSHDALRMWNPNFLCPVFSRRSCHKQTVPPALHPNLHRVL